jgi:enoyl-CoA hydratase
MSTSLPTTGLRVEESGSVLVVTLDRPNQRNAMTLAMARGIADAMSNLDRRDDLSVGILTGAGGTFCAGMDLKRFAAGERASIEGLGFGGLTEAPPRKPLIAAVEGWAVGGGFELVLTCDLVVASTKSRFGLPEAKRGLLARGGGAMRLPRRVPKPIALELLFTGEPMDADRAHHFGLVNRLTPDGEALSAALELATAIAANAPLSVLAAKRIVEESADWTADEMFQRQQPIADALFASADAAEGANAFAQGRKPQWSGR